MNSSSLLFTLAVAILYTFQHVQGMPDIKCMHPEYMQKATINCQRELYASLKEEPTKNCSKAVVTMMPACLNKTMMSCLEELLGKNASAMIPAGALDGAVNVIAGNTESFCGNIVPIMLEPVTNCTTDFYITQGMCVYKFQQKFKANYADPDLCSAYSTQVGCMKEAMESKCDAEEVKNMTMKYDFMFKREGNPFCPIADDVADGASNMIGQSLLVALCLFFIKLIV